MQPSQYKVFITGDGSHSVGFHDNDITFHSTRGAIGESRHVFIDAGLRYFAGQHPGAVGIRIFELGFGTGLNALLSAAFARQSAMRIEYVSIDRFPLPEEIFSALNCGALLNENILYKEILNTPWNQPVAIAPFFTLHKIHADFEHYSFNQLFDVFFFDAFAPGDQPALWTKKIFSGIYRALNPGGVLNTYSSKSVVRRTLKESGFEVQKLEGPPGKREIIRAVKPVAASG